jgi:hypothetical protein
MYLILLFLTDNFLEFRLVFCGPASARLGREHARRFGLPYAIAGVGLDGLGG